LLVNRVPPEYPEKARSKGIQGTVMLRATINCAGDMIDASVISGDPLLAKAAIKAAKRWRYRPYVLQGRQ
jgi:protein TonB